MESNKFHRAWLVMIGSCFLMMSLALITTCMGFFVQPVTEALGFERGAFTVYYSIAGLIGVVAMPMWGKIIPKIGVKMAVIIAGTGGAVFMAMFSLCKALPHFYIVGLLMGIMVAGMTVLPSSILISTWFEEKRGLAMGIVMACSGVGGAVFSPILANIIASQGWQAGYLYNGIFVFLLTVPTTLLLIKGSPAEVGLKPYGAKEQPQGSQGPAELPGVPASIAMKSLPFFALALGIVIINMVAGSIQHLPAHFVNVGIEPTAAAGIISVVMIVVIISKILLGMINDRFGPNIATAGAFSLMAVSMIGFPLVSSYTFAVGIGIIYAMGLAAVTVMPPLLTGHMFGQKDYSAIYAVIGAMASLGLALGTPIMGYVFDKTGSYNLAFYGCIVAAIITIILVIYSLKSSQTLWE